MQQFRILKLLMNWLQAFSDYEASLNCLVNALDPLLDNQPIHVPSWTGPEASFFSRGQNWVPAKALMSSG